MSFCTFCLSWMVLTYFLYVYPLLGDGTCIYSEDSWDGRGLSGEVG